MKGTSLRARRPSAREMPGRCGLRLAARTAPAALLNGCVSSVGR